MGTRETIISMITKAENRKNLFHFTRARNLPAIVHFDALMSSYSLYPVDAGKRRSEVKDVNYEGYPVTLNAHLRIPEIMIDAESSLEQFRSYLDRHVFFWPTLQYCRMMLETYTRREPEEAFAVLEFDAVSLLTDYYSAVKLSKYDSGSSPRFPKHCNYKKSPEMFLPISGFKSITNRIFPLTASEIKEVLIEDRVNHLSKYLHSVCFDDYENIPGQWRHLAKPQLTTLE